MTELYIPNSNELEYTVHQITPRCTTLNMFPLFPDTSALSKPQILPLSKSSQLIMISPLTQLLL